MTLIKGKDIKAKRERNAGAMVKWYPIQPINDMLSWEVVKRSSAEDGEWMTQLHSHPDFEEYWFVISGKGQMICGDEIYDVGPGDLVITPASVPHKVLGDIEWIACSAKHNVYGHTLGTKMQYLAHDKPYRRNMGDVLEPGTYLETDIMTKY